MCFGYILVWVRYRVSVRVSVRVGNPNLLIELNMLVIKPCLTNRSH